MLEELRKKLKIIPGSSVLALYLTEGGWDSSCFAPSANSMVAYKELSNNFHSYENEEIPDDDVTYNNHCESITE